MTGNCSKRRFAKFDARLYLNPKWISLSESNPAAACLWISSITYSADNLTDGHVTKVVARRALGATDETIKDLVDSRMWVESGDGWTIHDFSQWQLTRDEVEKRHEVFTAAGRAGGKRSAARRSADQPSQGSRVGSSQGSRVGSSQGSRVGSSQSQADIDIDIETESEKEKENNTPVAPSDDGADRAEEATELIHVPKPEKGEYPPAFEEFWKAYPSHQDKKPAYKAWKAAIRKGVPNALLIAKAHEYALSDAVQRGFIKHAATWLNDESWNNPPERKPRESLNSAELSTEKAKARDRKYAAEEAAGQPQLIEEQSDEPQLQLTEGRSDEPQSVDKEDFEKIFSGKDNQ